MSKENLFIVLKKAFIDFYKNWRVVMPSLLLFAFFVIFSEISVEVNRKLNSDASLTAWLIFFSLISLLALGAFLSGLIGMCFEAVNKRKTKIGDFLRYSKKFWLSNFIIIIVILVFYNIIWFIAHNAAMLIGKSLNLPLGIAKGVFFVLYFAGLAGAIIFLTFSSFYLIMGDRGIFKSLRSSALLVKREYIRTLSIIIIFFALNGILELLGNRIIIELINAVLIVPYLALVLTRFVLNSEKKNDLRT